jgi:uncharacterized membrane protein
MKNKLISWLPILVVLATMVSFKILNFANHHYSIFLLIVILAGFFLALTSRVLQQRAGSKEAACENEVGSNQ